MHKAILPMIGSEISLIHISLTAGEMGKNTEDLCLGYLGRLSSKLEDSGKLHYKPHLLESDSESKALQN